MKLFQTTDMNIVKDCQEYLSLSLPSSLVAKRTEKLLAKLNKPRLLVALSNTSFTLIQIVAINV